MDIAEKTLGRNEFADTKLSVSPSIAEPENFGQALAQRL